jgi:hypothetical protein
MLPRDTCWSGGSFTPFPVGTAVPLDATLSSREHWGAAAAVPEKWRGPDEMSGLPFVPPAPLALECDDLKTWPVDPEPGLSSRRMMRQLSPQSIMQTTPEMDRFGAIIESPRPARQLFPLVHQATAYCHSRKEHWTDELVWPSAHAAPLGSCLPHMDADWRTALSFFSGWHRSCLEPEPCTSAFQ